MNGFLVSKVSPVYPPLARQARITGTVILRAIIATDGSIKDLTLLSGHPMLAQAAMEAVRQWKYKPYLQNGIPVEIDTQIQVNFTLQDQPYQSQPEADEESGPDGSGAQPRVPKDSEDALLLHWTSPDFSAQPSAQQNPGHVVVKASISETGAVDDVEIIGGDPTLGAVAAACVKHWEFKPFILAGKPTQKATTVAFSFGQAGSSPGSQPPLATTSVVPFRVEVSQGVTTGLLTERVQPVYPAEARAAGIQGTVLLRAWINEEGTVTKLKRISGPRELTPAAKEAVQQWHYRPFIFMGNAVDVRTKVQINFTLVR